MYEKVFVALAHLRTSRPVNELRLLLKALSFLKC